MSDWYTIRIACMVTLVAVMQAETINAKDGKLVITPVDKKSIYIETIDKLNSAIVFAFPNVKPGSIIEYKYREAGQYFPTWYFQNSVPTRYSEIDVNIPNYHPSFSLLILGVSPMLNSSSQRVRAMEQMPIR